MTQIPRTDLWAVFRGHPSFVFKPHEIVRFAGDAYQIGSVHMGDLLIQECHPTLGGDGLHRGGWRDGKDAVLDLTDPCNVGPLLFQLWSTDPKSGWHLHQVGTVHNADASVSFTYDHPCEAIARALLYAWGVR